MEELDLLLNKMTVTDQYHIESEHDVEVTHINNPGSFYIRLTDYRRYLSNLEKQGEPENASELCLRKSIIYKSLITNTYIRGQIHFIENLNDYIKCDIFAIDYGFLEKQIPIELIYKPLTKTIIPPLAVHCKLANCFPLRRTSFSEESVIAMKTLIDNEPAKMYVFGKEHDKLIVVLTNSNPDDISTLLCLLDYTAYSTYNTSSNIQPEKLCLKYKTLKVGETLHVRVQWGSSLERFYVAEKNDYKKYLEERYHMSHLHRKMPKVNPLNVKEGDYVAIKINNVYERGVIKCATLAGSKALVQLIDSGETVEESFINMKTLSEKCFSTTAAAIYCSIDKSQTWDKGLYRHLHPGLEFRITVKQLGDKFNEPNLVVVSPK